MLDIYQRQAGVQEQPHSSELEYSWKRQKMTKNIHKKISCKKDQFTTWLLGIFLKAVEQCAENSRIPRS